MDGKSLFSAVYDQLNQDEDTSRFMNDKKTYDHIYSAAVELTRRTNCLTATQTITTVAEQSLYDINADYLKLYLRNDDNEFYIKYYDGTNTTFVKFKEYEEIVEDNNTDSVDIPYYFSIIDKQTLTARITGTTTSAGALTNGETTLTDSAAPFTNVSVGDTVHNTTDSSEGKVIEKTSNSALVTNLFNGTDNTWGSGDAYIIIPQGRKQLILDPASLTSGHTITFYYTVKPAPVYSSYRTYRFNQQYQDALVMYACYLYKLQDEKANYGATYYRFLMIWLSLVYHKRINRLTVVIRLILSVQWGEDKCQNRIKLFF